MDNILFMEDILFIGFIYKISKKGNDGVYIGSTKDVNLRHATHKRNCNNVNEKAYNFKVYRHIRENGGWDSWKFEIIKIEYNLTVEQLGKFERDFQIKEGHNLGTKRRDNGAKVICACGGKYYKRNKHGHGKSKKHKKYIEEFGEEFKRWEEQNKINKYKKTLEFKRWEEQNK